VPYRHRAALVHLAAWWLEPLRSRFGPVTVHSGYRTPAHNLVVGGARHSVHLLTTPLPRRPRGSVTVAAAADITCRHGGPQEWRCWAMAHRAQLHSLGAQARGGVGLYPTFVHLDTGPSRDWLVG
jgi:hypothetical protein